MDRRGGLRERSLADAAVAENEDMLAARIEGATDLHEHSRPTTKVLRAGDSPGRRQMDLEDRAEAIFVQVLDRHTWSE